MPKSNNKITVYRNKRMKPRETFSNDNTKTRIVANPRILGFPRYNTLNPFPAMMRKKMPYASIFPLTSTTPGVFGSQKTFVINSIYNTEPVAGHQPYGFDQLCSASGPYTQFKVLGVQMKITCNNETGGVNFRLGTVIHNVTSNYAIQSDTINSAGEKPNVRLDFVSNTGSQSKTFKVNIPIFPLYNWTKEQYDLNMSNLTCGTYNSDPLDKVHFDLAVAAFTGNAAASCSIEFLYDVVFFDRFIMAQS